MLAGESPSQSILRSTPFPPAMSKPTGPFKLSTHPGSGSLRLGMTKHYENFILFLSKIVIYL